MQLDGGTVTLSMEEIKSAYPNIRSLIGNSVYVKASVLTKAGKHEVWARISDKLNKSQHFEPQINKTINKLIKK